MTRFSYRRLTPFLKGSILFHLAGLAALVVRPHLWVTVLSALVADQAIVLGAGIHPRNSLLGPNRSRLDPERTQMNSVALTFDDGPDPALTPRVLEILAEHDCRATFFVIGRKAQDNADTIRAITAAGHELGNHSWEHSAAFFFHSPARLAAEIDRTQALIGEIAGVLPTLFRAPAGIRSPLLRQELDRRNLELVSWSRRAFDTVDRRPDKILRRLTLGLTAGEILLLHDGAALSFDGSPAILKVLPALLETLKSLALKPEPVSLSTR